MPIYDFLCASCEHKFSVITQEMKPPSKVTCPNCGSEKVFRSWNAPPVHFKGDGFYTTDKEGT